MASMSPLPHALSASIKNSFAYKTVKDRLPTILTKTIDTTHRHKHEILSSHGQEGSDDLKAIIHRLSELRYRLTTDKPLTPIEGKKPDVAVWNAHLEKMEAEGGGEKQSWFKSTWLDVECYFYRKIQEAFEMSRFLYDWDPFRFQKEQSFVGAIESMTILSEHMKKLLEQADKMKEETKKINVEKLFQISLWGNKFDLSVTGGEQVQQQTASPIEQVDELRDHVLVNDLKSVLNRLFEKKPDKQHHCVDFVLDNVGMELFADLCLGEMLLSLGICNQVDYYVKSYPWFVSDVTCADFYWTLEMLLGNPCKALKELGEKWQQRLDDKSFTVRTHGFWTSPYAFNRMPEKAEDLYKHFNDESLLTIFKGDLNYRKLVGDLAWPSTTPFERAVREFRPKTPYVVLRTMKADVVTGMKEGEAEKMAKEKEDWMTSGDYAVIQYCAPSSG